MNDKEYIQTLPEDVHYYHVEKSGSSSMGGTLNKFGKFNRSYLSENVVAHSDCGFTFVREPISRFISGYYTVNKLIFMHNKYALKPYDIPKRFGIYTKSDGISIRVFGDLTFGTYHVSGFNLECG